MTMSCGATSLNLYYLDREGLSKIDTSETENSSLAPTVMHGNENIMVVEMLQPQRTKITVQY